MKYLLGAATAALLLAGATAASAAQATGFVTATATVISPLTEDVSHQMGFGKLVLDNSGNGGTLVLSTAGGRTQTGGVNLVGGASGMAAEVDFVGDSTNGAPNPYDVSVDTGATLSDGHSHSMTVTSITTSTNPGTGLTGLTASQAVSIGGTLNVAAGQAAGTYSGTFNITGAYE
jgi:hypothetical protein